MADTGLILPNMLITNQILKKAVLKKHAVTLQAKWYTLCIVQVVTQKKYTC
jgi:hypothetical protein